MNVSANEESANFVVVAGAQSDWGWCVRRRPGKSEDERFNQQWRNASKVKRDVSVCGEEVISLRRGWHLEQCITPISVPHIAVHTLLAPLPAKHVDFKHFVVSIPGLLPPKIVRNNIVITSNKQHITLLYIEKTGSLRLQWCYRPESSSNHCCSALPMTKGRLLMSCRTM